MDQVKKLWREIVSPGKAALVMAVLGYFLTISSSSSTTRNGVITSCSYMDIGALIFGGLGLWLAGAAAKDARGSRNVNLNYAVAGIGLLFAILNLTRGLGVIGSPCP